MMILALVAVSAMGKEMPPQGFGVHIGWAQPILRLNMPTNPSSAKDSLTTHIKMYGFKAGVVYDGSFIAGFGTSIGLNYTFGMSNSGWSSVNPNYGKYPQQRRLITYQELELFVDWQYKFEIAKGTYLILYTGPTLQCGLGLTMRQDKREENLITGNMETTYGIQYSGYSNEADPDQVFKRLNVTWGVGAGFQYQRYFLRGGYDFGLIVPYKNADFANGYHTRGRLDQWSIKIGAYLWYEK